MVGQPDPYFRYSPPRGDPPGSAGTHGITFLAHPGIVGVFRPYLDATEDELEVAVELLNAQLAEGWPLVHHEWGYLANDLLKVRSRDTESDPVRPWVAGEGDRAIERLRALHTARSQRREWEDRQRLAELHARLADRGQMPHS